MSDRKKALDETGNICVIYSTARQLTLAEGVKDGSIDGDDEGEELGEVEAHSP